MVEELYVISNNKRYRLDLSLPSGITLNFKSNIFGDLSKITASYSYTFKLPMTANNRMVMDMAEDVRHSSAMIRKRLKCEYIQNGIPLFSNANLYIDSVESGYNAVMTWGVIDGFQTLKDNDCSIRDLNHNASTTFGPTNAIVSQYMNVLTYVRPLYNAGLPYVTENGWKDQYNTYSFFPLPAVPIYRIISLVNSKFGTKFKFGPPIIWPTQDDFEGHPIIKRGVIPLVTAEATEEQKLADSYPTYFSGGGYYSYCKIDDKDIGNILVGATNDPEPSNSLYTLKRFSSDNMSYGFKVNSNAKMTFEVNGCLHRRFTHVPGDYSGQGTVTLTPTGNSRTYSVKLSFYATTNGSTATELASIEGKYLNDGSWWEFDFAEENGKDRIEITVPPNAIVFMAYSCDTTDLRMTTPAQVDKLITFIPQYKPENISWSEFEDSAGSYPIDIASNLPDISCMTLFKALYFMMGAFPTVNADSEIVPVTYSQVRDNLANAIDWSKKLLSDDGEQAEKVEYSVNGYGQRNYFLMKNDSLDSIKDEEDEIYEVGIGCIEVANEVIDREKTIIQLPFNTPYLKNKKFPKIATGNTIHFWTSDSDGGVSTKEAKPAFGMIKAFPQTKADGTATDVVWMGMEIWNQFPHLDEDDSYAYLQRVLADPFVVTEYLNLNEFDLKELDYAVPVYLSKYNSYFAIVSITRDSKGKCKCELLKLPNE